MINKKFGFNRLKGAAALGVLGTARLACAGSVQVTSAYANFFDLRAPGIDYWAAMNNAIQPFDSTIVTGNSRAFTVSAGPAYGISFVQLMSTTYYATRNCTTGYRTYPPYSFYSNCTYVDHTNYGYFGQQLESALVLAVNGTWFVNPDTSVDLTDNTVTTDPQLMSGLEVQTKYTLLDTAENFAMRGLFSFTNTTGSTISADVLIGGNFQVDSNVAVSPLSNDQVAVVSEVEGYHAYTLLSRYGGGAAVIPADVITLSSNAGGSDGSNFGFEYNISVTPGQTVRLLTVIESVVRHLHESKDGEVAASERLASFNDLNTLFDAGMLAELSVTEINELVNYGSNGDIDSDGMPDNYEVSVGLDPLLDDASGDLDGDFILNIDEYNAGTNPNNNDTDNDGVLDGIDDFPTHLSFAVDTDGDGLPDGFVASCNLICQFNTDDPIDWDDDNDGVPDVVDVAPLDNANTNEIDLPLDGEYKGKTIDSQVL